MERRSLARHGSSESGSERPAQPVIRGFWDVENTSAYGGSLFNPANYTGYQAGKLRECVDCIDWSGHIDRDADIKNIGAEE